MPAAAMTYDSLVSDILSYCERSDAEFQDMIPRFIMQGEFRIAEEVQNLGARKSVTSAMQAENCVVAKPARWRKTYSINFGTGTGSNKRNSLFPRSYEFCTRFWPNRSLSYAAKLPRYYADYDYNNWLIVPTPAAAYPFEVNYHELVSPLSAESQTNWTTENAPNLILYACLLEAQGFLKNPELAQGWQAAYDRAASAVGGYEQKSRESDSSEKRDK